MKNTMLFLTLLLPLLLAAAAFSQDTADEPLVLDKVELHDGSTLVGEIVDFKAGVQLELRLRSGRVVTIPYTDVKLISQFTADDHLSRPYEFREKGWFGTASAELIFGNTGPRYSGDNGYQFTAGGGYHFGRLLGLGLETGFRQMVDGTGENFIPAGIAVRGFPWSNRIAPFYQVSGGYAFVLNKDDPDYRDKEGGLYIQPAIGLRLGGSSGANAFVKVSHLYQRSKFDYPVWIWGPPPTDDGPYQTQKVTYKRWTISAGVMF